MLPSVQDYMNGYLDIQYCGIECTRFINLCHNHHLNIWNIRCNHQTVYMSCDKNDFKKMKQIRRKCGGHLKIINRHGLCFFLRKKRKHICYFIGIGIFFLIGKLLSLYIWNISFEGNYSNTNVELSNFLKQHSYVYGMKKSEIDCEDLEHLLRTNYPDITWVSVELKGTKLKIYMKENFEGYSVTQDSRSCDLIADSPAVITNIVTRTGVPMVRAGDTVEAGQVLVSGILDNYGDNETFISRTFVHADADIYADVMIPYEDKFPMTYQKKNYTGNSHIIYTLRLFHKKLYFSLPFRNYENADFISEETQFCLFDDFYFPVHIGNMKLNEYTQSEIQYSEAEAKAIAAENLDRFVKKIEEKGIQIIENNVTIESNHEICSGIGTLKVNQKIGTVSYINEEEHRMKGPLEDERNRKHN